MLFSLRIPGIETHLAQRTSSEREEVRDATLRLVAHAPVTAGLTALLWQLVDRGQETAERLPFVKQLATAELSPQALHRWKKIAADADPEIRATALKVLADKAPEEAADQIVSQLALVDYDTQQHLIEALAKVARSQGPAFIDRLLPLMASGEAGIRSAVVKILLEMDDRHELVKRYLKFSRTLAGWARDRALDSMREFGDDLVEPTVELLSDPDEEVRTLALAVVGAFEDPRIIPATVELLGAEDWWLRICAADTLGQFNDPRAVDALMAALDDAEARWAAVEALGRIGDPRCLSRLSKLLNDPAPEVRIEVLLALPQVRPPECSRGPAAGRQVGPAPQRPGPRPGDRGGGGRPGSGVDRGRRGAAHRDQEGPDRSRRAAAQRPARLHPQPGLLRLPPRGRVPTHRPSRRRADHRRRGDRTTSSRSPG